MVLAIGETLQIDNTNGTKIVVKSTIDGLIVKNISECQALFVASHSKDILFTNARPILSWRDFDLSIGNTFGNTPK